MRHMFYLVIAGVAVRVLSPYAQAFFANLPGLKL
jgi:hypothetical protein